jgi:hypothetical protein
MSTGTAFCKAGEPATAGKTWVLSGSHNVLWSSKRAQGAPDDIGHAERLAGDEQGPDAPYASCHCYTRGTEALPTSLRKVRSSNRLTAAGSENTVASLARLCF